MSAIENRKKNRHIFECKTCNYNTCNKYEVLKISSILTKPEDFTLGIEPSATGGAKLVSEMLTW